MAKFLSLLDRSALYFPRLDAPEVKLEGFYTKPSLPVSIAQSGQVPFIVDDVMENRMIVQNLRKMLTFSKQQRKHSEMRRRGVVTVPRLFLWESLRYQVQLNAVLKRGGV